MNGIGGLTKASWTPPQKHVAVASVSVDQPSLAPPATGKYFFDLSAVVAMIVGCTVLALYNKEVSMFETGDNVLMRLE